MSGVFSFICGRGEQEIQLLKRFLRFSIGAVSPSFPVSAVVTFMGSSAVFFCDLSRGGGGVDVVSFVRRFSSF